jgi:hypothetical protein
MAAARASTTSIATKKMARATLAGCKMIGATAIQESHFASDDGNAGGMPQRFQVRLSTTRGKRDKLTKTAFAYSVS